METKDYLQDIKEIKNMMSQSTQFISLSGLSGVLAGIYALIGAVVANRLIENSGTEIITVATPTFQLILLTAFVVLVLSLGTAYWMTSKKAAKLGEKVWNPSSKRMVINFLIPLVSGGIFALVLIRHNFFELTAPILLLFYGLACVNASKYTLRDVRYLGITEIILGLIATEFINYGLYFWIVGFGVCHILYGSIMYFKYDRK
jgi:hypothetical protein